MGVVAMLLLPSVFFTQCSKDNSMNAVPPPVTEGLPISSDPACSFPYAITLQSKVDNGNGTYTWTWSIVNPNPGNGSNGTVQDLSHFGLTLGDCLSIDSVVSAEYQSGGAWVNVPVALGVDPGMQNCIAPYSNVTMLKFGVGTSGTTPTVFRITIEEDLSVDMNAVAYYKSGANTACGQICFPGFGCPVPPPPPPDTEGCSLSQGYWFAKPNLVWTSNVTVGGHSYTQAEGKAIWNTSNAGGISDAKKAFTQVAAIKLSGSTVLPTATVWQYVTIAEAWLATLPKLSADGAAGTLKVQPKTSANTNAAAGSAGGSIGRWIDLHHCE